MQSPIRTFDTFSQGRPCCNRYDLTTYRNHFPCLQSCFGTLIGFRIVETGAKHFFGKVVVALGLGQVSCYCNFSRKYWISHGCWTSVASSNDDYYYIAHAVRVLISCWRSTDYVRDAGEGSYYESGGSGRISRMSINRSPWMKDQKVYLLVNRKM